MTTDPVCGMQVEEQTAAGSSVFEGSKYYFCSAGCKKKFDANPSAYIGTRAAGDTSHAEHAHPHAETTRNSPDCAHGAPAVVGAVAPGTDYTCPMHPEIVRNAPGDCPICGMARRIAHDLWVHRAGIGRSRRHRARDGGCPMGATRSFLLRLSVRMRVFWLLDAPDGRRA